MSARLAASPSAGAESIHAAVNLMIGCVIDAVDAFGGVSIGLFGDAVLSVWPEGRARQALECAQALPGRLEETVPATDVLPLRMVLDAGEVSRVETASDPVFVGAVLERLRLYSGASDALLQTSSFEAALGRSAEDTKDVSAWRAQIPQHDRVWSAEIRTTTVLFVQAETARLSEAGNVQDFAKVTTQAAEDFGARVLMTGLDDKGLLAILAWGLPGSTSDGESDLAIAAAQQITASPSLELTNCSIARGRGFCGVLGGEGFAKYTVLGHHVNNAAGALAAAKGAIVCDVDTQVAARRYDFEPAELFRDKTGAQRQLFRPKVQAENAQEFHAALVGREEELSTLQAFAEGQGRAAPRVLWVVADAGLGKSHLLAEFQSQVKTDARRVLHLTGDRLRQMGSFLPWQAVFAALPEATRTAWSPDQIALLRPVLPDAGGGEALASGPDRSDGEGAAAQAFMAEVLVQDIGSAPTLVIVEDAHWIDSASWQLLAQVFRRCENLRILAASRPRTKDVLTDDAAGLLYDAQTERLTLAPLTAAATGALVAQTLTAKELPDELLNRIFGHCEGNPLYTLQITRHLREIGSILVRDGHVVIGGDYEFYRDIPLPNSLEDALAARVLVASEMDQMVLRIASAQGRRFQEGVVAALLPEEMAQLDLGRALARLHEAALVDPAEAAGDWQFQHALIREATYGLLTRAQKGHLHGRIAPLLAAQETRPEVLAYHWLRAGQPAAALPCLDRAAERAFAENASHEALDFVDQALEAATQVEAGTVSQDQRVRWNHIAASSASQLGQHYRSRDYATAGLRELGIHLAQKTPARVLQLLKGVLKYKLRLTSPPSTERERAQMRDAIRAHRIVGDMSYDRKDTLGLLSAAVHSINLARDLDEVGPASAIAHSSIAMIGLHVPALADGRHHMDIATAMIDESDPITAARVLYTAGNFEFGRGNWQAGYEALDTAVLYARRAHAYRSQFIAMASLANMSRLHGHIRRSHDYDHDTINVALDHGANHVEVWALVGAIKCLVSLNEFDALDEAIVRMRALLSDPANWENASVNSRIALPLCRGIHHLHAGRVEEGLAEVTAAAEMFGREKQLQVFAVDLAIYFALALRLMARAGVDADVLKKMGAMVHKQSKALAKIFPPARPVEMMIAGDVAAQHGRQEAARERWASAEAASEAADMPYMAAACAHRLATAGEASALARRDAALVSCDTPLPEVWA